MNDTKMYSERKGNIAVFRGCDFSCIYCAFKNSLKRNSCERCRVFEPHTHMEVLEKIPPKTKEGEFLTVGLTSDISFMNMVDFWKVIEYCRKWKDRTFLIQSKNPAYFLRFQENILPLRIPHNVVIGTTIETNRDQVWDARTTPRIMSVQYSDISKAPPPVQRYEAMLKITSKIAITIEPILDMDMYNLVNWIKILAPSFVYIGYNSNLKQHLPEPQLEKTVELVRTLRDAGIEVREKLMRKAWYEG
jgi:DNA repair photolyase